MPWLEQPIKTDLTPEAFLEFELASQEKHAFVQDQIFLLAVTTGLPFAWVACSKTRARIPTVW
ncbi:hypothetical protein [Meiothermus sp.]|jgi:hypothetical protein|uniref:hypothetical protein n=1 Tax=Meiothermus sp. TaxID=1955249 RepID=UPI0021DC662F|nr:hypothetical protein [Meiothermus sp.]GIW24528.1 MAG: hypothetical protein KatS3mg069_0795 [Meiothermus sp.]